MITGYVLMLIDYEYQGYIGAGYNSFAPIAAFFSKTAAEEYITAKYPAAVYSSTHDEWTVGNTVLRLREIEMEEAHG